MRLLLPSLLAALVVASAGPALAGSNQACRPQALSILQASSPDGFAIYERIGRPAFFRSWIDCDASQYDLSTAVHESAHFIASETDAFPLVGGGAIARPHEVSDFFPPYRIADRFAADDFTTIYLTRGKASSSTDLLYLLDEFNAYSHDLDTAVDLRDLSSPDEVVDHRDGLAAMMAFLAAYAERARTTEPDTWSGLQHPEVATTVSTLWERAERVMARSCGIPNFGTSDRSYIGRVCEAGARSAIGQLLGRPPACPAACLEPAPKPGSAGADVETSSASPRYAEAVTRTQDHGDADQEAADLPRNPFAGNIGARRRRTRGEAE